MKIRVLIFDNAGRDDGAIEKLHNWIESDTDSSVNLSSSIDFNPDEIIDMRPDLVIIDVALDAEEESKLRDIKNQNYIPNSEFYSGLSGIMFCHQLKSNFSNIPVVLITNHFDSNIFSAVFEAGADGFLYKEDLRPKPTMSNLKSIFYKSRTDDSVLYQAVRDLLDNRGEDAWECKHMSLALDAFFSRGSGPRRLLSLWQCLAELVEKTMSSDVVETLLQAEIDAEALLIAANPTMRDHIRHTGNVFWIGYYLINSLDFFRHSENFEGINVTSSKSGSRPARDRLNLMWILASLLHDIGYIRERLPIVEDRLQRVKDLLWGSSKKAVPPEQNAVPEPLEPIFDELKAIDSIEANQLSEALSYALNRWKTDGEVEPFRDHGIVAAAAVLRQVKQSCGEKFSPELKHAAIAIAFHNLHKWNKWLSPPAKINIESFPIVWLLSYCDELQGWSREPDGAALIGCSEEPPEHPKEGVANAYIEGSRIFEFSCIPDENTQLDAQLSIGIQYILAHGDNTLKLVNKVRTDILKWRRETASLVRDTLQLDGLIATKILHRVPAPVPEPIQVFLDKRGDSNP